MFIMAAVRGSRLYAIGTTRRHSSWVTSTTHPKILSFGKVRHGARAKSSELLALVDGRLLFEPLLEAHCGKRLEELSAPQRCA